MTQGNIRVNPLLQKIPIRHITQRMNPFVAIRTLKLRMTQAKMARLLGVSQSLISHWETGRRQPSLTEQKKIRKLAIACGVRWQDRWFFEAAA